LLRDFTVGVPATENDYTKKENTWRLFTQGMSKDEAFPLFHINGERYAHYVLRAHLALYAHRFAVEVQLSDPGSLGSKAPDTRI
jgi:hypothetical protein